MPRLVDDRAGARGRRPRRSGARRRARARSRGAARRAALRARAATCATRAAGAGRSTAPSSVLDAARRATASCAATTYPDALRARVGGADVPDLRRRAALGRARLRVRRLGRRRPRRRRQPRLAAPQRLARRAGLLRRRRRRTRPPAAWSIADVAPMVRAHFGAVSRLRSPSPSAARACRRRAPRVARRPHRGRRAAAAALDDRRAGRTTDRPDAPSRRGLDKPPAGYRLTGHAGAGDRRRAADGRSQARTRAPRRRARTSSRRAGARWQVSYYVTRGKEPQGDRAGLRRRRHGPRDRGVDRLAGRVDDGPRLPGRVRAQGQLAVGVDPAHAALRRAVRRPAPAAADAATSTCWSSCAFGVSRGLLQRRATSTSRSRSPTRCWPTCSARMLWIGLRRGRAAATRCACSCRSSWLAIGAASSSSASASGSTSTNSNVIDVGYAGVIGADRLADGDQL